MPSIVPEVNPKSEFAEIANDFSNPLEIIRESISNSFDANADTILVEAYVDRSTGLDELVVRIKDDGTGISENDLRSFFGLGFSTRTARDQRGNKISGSVGEKGHGTKIYYNSREVQLITVKDNLKIMAVLKNPLQTLHDNTSNMLKVEYEVFQVSEENGTEIIVYGYNNNQTEQFSHNQIKDYIFWFTKFGSPEGQVRPIEHDPKLTLRGLGNEVGEVLTFGHPFPEEASNILDLKRLDHVSYLDFYVAKWIFRDVHLSRDATKKIDIIFYIEGDKAKRGYNRMIHERFAPWTGGVYNVEQRYGLWLCKDFIPIETHNDWVAEKTEWTKYHAFVNSQDIRLTANRGDAGNTNKALLDNIKETVKDKFQNVIERDVKYTKYKEEIERFKQYANAEKEEADFNRRKRAAVGKQVAQWSDVLILEPRQEGGVYSIVIQLLTIDPNIFNFTVIDYDTSFGYDLLVTKDSALDLNQANMQFIEMKYILKNDFNHSYRKLAAIICWDTNIPNDYVLVDMTGEKRTMRITGRADNSAGYTKYMLISNTQDHNIEVFILKKYLKEKLDIDFGPRELLADD